MPLKHENTRLFWKLFGSSYKESSHEESKRKKYVKLP